VYVPAELQIVTVPAGVNVAIERYVNVDGKMLLEPLPDLGSIGPTPIDRLELPPCSYRFRLSLPGQRAVVLPKLLVRGAHERIDLSLPASVPDGYVYIPPGWSLEGSDQPEMLRRAMHSAPLHQVYMAQAYLIGQDEVTFADWLEYLKTRPPGDPDLRLLERLELSNVAGITLHWRHGWEFSFYRSPSRTPVFTAREGESFRYPGRTRRATGDWTRLPLAGISAEHLGGYLSWRHARLCSEREWERAARGADGRSFPNGDRLAPDDANIDVTYGRQQDAFGPDPVGSHPDSTSPFGVNDMAGNIGEMTTAQGMELGQVVLRGGGWYYEDFAALILSRSPSEPTFHDAITGVRLCADPGGDPD
jgi:formylglycine-generating enzyme required for sulfatase activity